MFAPGGVTSLIMMNLRVAAFGKFKRLVVPYLGLIATTAIFMTGAAVLIEMTYHMQLNAALGPVVPLFGVELDTSKSSSWIIASVLLVVGVALFEMVRRRFVRIWGHAQEEIEAEIKRRETA
jgi:branched-chain amino acid transport system permease protein